jgi:hypothetical protein
VAIAHDTETRFPSTDGTTTVNSVDTTTGDRSFTHAASASAKGAVVAVLCTGTTNTLTGVTYGGVSMTLTASATDTTEAGRVDLYTLVGSSFPSGSQSVVLQGASATAKWACCSSVTASNNVIINTSGAVNTTVGANPTVTLTTIARDAMAYAASHSGAAAPATTGIAGCTIQRSNDYGALCANTVRWTNVTAAGATGIGVTLGSDDHCIAGVAFSELETDTFPTTSVLDDFNRANEGPPPSANWATDQYGLGLAGFQVTSNQLDASNNNATAYWSASTFGPDCECYVTLTTWTFASNDVDLVARLQGGVGTSAVDGYTVKSTSVSGASNDTIKIMRLDNASNTQLGATITLELANGDGLGMECDGTSISAYYKPSGGSWIRADSRTDATHAGAGNLGIFTGNTGAVFDDFGGGTIVVAAVTTRLLASTGVGK